MTKLARLKAVELCAALDTDRAKIGAVSDYIARSMLYDYLKAKTVRKTYRPDPDVTVKSQKGICWDFAVLAKVMLESQGIKCRVAIGHSDGEYHAWNDVWLDGEWVRYDMTAMVIGRPRITYKAERFA